MPKTHVVLREALCSASAAGKAHVLEQIPPLSHYTKKNDRPYP